MERRAFGAALRRERERRQIALNAIAEQTKIGAPLLAGLEQGDLSHWPGGIFRRSFVRAYASAVGLDVEEIVNEFTRLFPDEEAAAEPTVTPKSEDQPAKSSAVTHRTGRVARLRVAAAFLDTVVVGAVAVLVYHLLDATAFWPVAALVAVAYYAVGTSVLGAPLCTRWLARPAVVTVHAAPPQPAPPAPKRRPADAVSKPSATARRRTARRVERSKRYN